MSGGEEGQGSQMTSAEWTIRMELLADSVIATRCCLARSKSTGVWVLIGFGLDGDVGVMTGKTPDNVPGCPPETALMFRWGARSDLANLLGLSGLSPDSPNEGWVFSDCIMDRVIAGTWDASRDSPSYHNPEVPIGHS